MGRRRRRNPHRPRQSQRQTPVADLTKMPTSSSLGPPARQDRLYQRRHRLPLLPLQSRRRPLHHGGPQNRRDEGLQRPPPHAHPRRHRPKESPRRPQVATHEMERRTKSFPKSALQHAGFNAKSQGQGEGESPASEAEMSPEKRAALTSVQVPAMTAPRSPRQKTALHCVRDR